MKERAYLDLEDVQRGLLPILSSIKETCDRNHLRYYLAFGTLIGAVRHGGFIPWDDDIDIWMPRPDYNRFIQCFSHSVYEFHSMETDWNWPLPFAKVCDKRYSAMSIYGMDFGLFIDIFPLDGIPQDERSAQKHINRIRKVEKLWSNQLLTRKLKVSGSYPSIKNLKIIISRIFSPFIPFDSIRKRVISLYSKYDYDSSETICSLCGRDYRLFKSYFDPPVQLLFEGTLFSVPNQYDIVLRLWYGNYMEIPPIERRQSHEMKVYLKD